MITCICKDLDKNNEFELVFWDYQKFESFKRKCKYSKRIRILAILDNTKYYD